MARKILYLLNLQSFKPPVCPVWYSYIRTGVSGVVFVHMYRCVWCGIRTYASMCPVWYSYIRTGVSGVVFVHTYRCGIRTYVPVCLVWYSYIRTGVSGVVYVLQFIYLKS
jgi:hypothetical protein